jgi:hypothetical protein
MPALILEIILQIMHMQIAIGKRLPRCDVEIANDLVYADGALQAAALAALGVEVFGVVLALALLDAFAAAKRPGYGGVGVAHFVACVAAAGFGGAGGGWGAVAFAAVVGREVGGFVFVS